jgi:hypothetical protein
MGHRNLTAVERASCSRAGVFDTGQPAWQGPLNKDPC